MGEEEETCLCCNEEIDTVSEFINCNSVCKRRIHIDCAHVSSSAVKAIRDFDNINYTCDNCSRFAIPAINNKIDGMYQYLYKIKDMEKSAIDNNKALNNKIDKLIEVVNNLCENNKQTNKLKATEENKTTKNDKTVNKTYSSVMTNKSLSNGRNTVDNTNAANVSKIKPSIQSETEILT